MAAAKLVRVGTRASLLALTQTGSVLRQIKKSFPRVRFETVTIKTTGDKIQDAPLSRVGTQGLFIKEIEEALLLGAVDLAVHSLKDLPTEIAPGLKIGAVLKREDPRDCLVSRRGWTLTGLPKGAKVGTSSLRRRAQTAALRPDLRVEDLRGNLDTRLRKLKSGDYDAIVLAWAGLRRLAGQLSLEGLKLRRIHRDQMLPAVGQGSLAVEIRKGDARMQALVRPLNDREAVLRAQAERAFLSRLQGGCQVPVGVLSRVQGKKIFLEGMVASLDGRKLLRDRLSGPAAAAPSLGDRLARRLLKAGGEKILAEIRESGGGPPAPDQAQKYLV